MRTGEGGSKFSWVGEAQLPALDLLRSLPRSSLRVVGAVSILRVPWNPFPICCSVRSRNSARGQGAPLASGGHLDTRE